ncbi:MAG TPA: BON domain-containing protein [Thermomicrobiales bacterium]|nr:BON domain-containing protein [Thermomicrobiales bacterium]
MTGGDWNRDRDQYMGGQDYEMGQGYGERGWGEQGFGRGPEFVGRGYGGEFGGRGRGYGGQEFQGRGYGGPGYRQGFNAGSGERGWGQEYGGRGYGPEFGRGYGNEGYGAEYGARGWGQQAYGGGYGMGQGYEGQGFGGRGRGWGYGGGFGVRGYSGFADEGPIVYGGPWSNQRGSGDMAWAQQSGGPGGQQGRGGATTVGPHTGHGPKGYQRSDNRIEEDVNEALTQNGHLDATNIQVKVDQGVVTLTGTVDSRQDKRMAEDIADSCPGVKDVNNQIRVEQGGNGQVGQTQQRQGQPQTAKAGASSSHS